MKAILLLILMLCCFLPEMISQEFVYNERKDVYYFVENEGDKPNKDIRYYDVGEFVNGLCRVSDGDYWGLVNDQGDEIVSLEYDQIVLLRDSLLVVELKNQFGVMHANGNMIFEISYSHIVYKSMLRSGKGYRGGVPAVKLDAVEYRYDLKTKQFELFKRQLPGEVFKVVEDMPDFFAICDDSSMKSMERMKCNREQTSLYFQPLLSENGFGKVRAVAQFIVRSDGTIEQIEIVQTENESANDVILEGIKNMEVRDPGRQRGTAVNVLITLPINI